MGADVHRWGVDRCRESSGDRQDQWHCTLPGAPCVQGMARYSLLGDLEANCILKGTQSRTQHQLELEIENMGGHLNAYTSVRPSLQ